MLAIQSISQFWVACRGNMRRISAGSGAEKKCKRGPRGKYVRKFANVMFSREFHRLEWRTFVKKIKDFLWEKKTLGEVKYERKTHWKEKTKAFHPKNVKLFRMC